MLIFKHVIQSLGELTTKELRIAYGPSIILFPYAHSTGGNAVVIRTEQVKVLLPYHGCASLLSSSGQRESSLASSVIAEPYWSGDFSDHLNPIALIMLVVSLF